MSRPRSTTGSRSQPCRWGSHRDASMRASPTRRTARRWATDRGLRSDRLQARRHARHDRGGAALTYRAAWLKDQGRPYTTEAAIAKLRGARRRSMSPARRSRSTAGTATRRSLPSPAHTVTRRCWRSARARAEILRLVIARDLEDSSHRSDPVPSGRYAVRGRSGDVVGTEDFRCAPGPGRLEVLLRDPPERADASWGGRRRGRRRRMADHPRARIETRGASDPGRARRRFAHRPTGRRRDPDRLGPDMHLDYLTPAMNAITGKRLGDNADRRRLPRTGEPRADPGAAAL